MKHDPTLRPVAKIQFSENGSLLKDNPMLLPACISASGERASRRYLEFFTANIRNLNTRLAYGRAVALFFDWCDRKGLSLHKIEPIAVAAYVEELLKQRSTPTVKQSLAAIKMLFDWLVTGHVLNINPAAAVRGPKYVTKRGKTPVLTANQARMLLESITTSTIIGLRDRALIGVMVYSFARVSAVVNLMINDYFQDGKKWWFRFKEKGGKLHLVPAHHNAEDYLDAYLDSAGIPTTKDSPIFRTVNRHRALTDHAMSRTDALKMIKRRARTVGLPTNICCHTFRATGITAYLNNGGTIEMAQTIAGHASPRTTKLYDRTGDEITLDEVERIAI